MHTLKKLSLSRSIKRQSGLSLLESLVALVVLALGIMGLAGVQTRLLVETRTANSRAVAVQLIDDLTNRMALNRLAAIGRPQSLPPIASLYTFAWGAAMPAAQNCTNPCTAAQMAQSDLFLWRTAINTALPGAQATVFQLAPADGDPRQLGIAIGWPLNERQADATYNAPFNVTTINNIGNCPATLICHLVYVQP
jgi:type IV pilus assembly protein PilV